MHTQSTESTVLCDPKREFASMFLRVAVPIFIQNVLAAFLHIIDTIMVGQLGSTYIASVGLAGQMSFLLMICLFGISNGGAVFSSQYWGAKDLLSIRKVLGIALVGCAGIGLVFTLAGRAFPFQILGLFSTDGEVIRLGGNYLAIVCFGYVFMGISMAMSAVLRATESARLPMITGMAAIVTNTVLNYAFIFGKLGMPRMEEKGAALATAIACAVDAILLVVLSRKRRNVIVSAPIRQFFSADKAFIKRYLITIAPIAANEVMWGTGTTVLNGVYGHMGTTVYAAIGIFGTVQRLVFVMSEATGNASAVMVGKYVGAGDTPLATRYAKWCLMLSVFFGVLISGALYLIRYRIFRVFDVEPPVMEMAVALLGSFCLVNWAKFYNFTSIIGVLRAGGDTRMAAIIDIAAQWGVAIPLAFITGIWLKLPIQTVYLIISVEEVFKAAAGYIRFRSGRWVRRLTAPQPKAARIVEEVEAHAV